MTKPSASEAHTWRRIELIRAGWGAALLLAPRHVLRVTQVPVDARAVAVARVLGARQLAQATLSGVEPSPHVLALGVWVDCAHATTAAALAAADPSRARAALTDAAVAGIWAGAGDRDLRGGVAAAPSHERRRDELARLVLGLVPGGRALLRRADRDRP